MKKMTVLLGSPRRGGNSEMLADSLVRGFGGTGGEALTIRLADLRLGGCVDCRRCWSSGRPCVIDDDMQSVYLALDEAEIVVFVSPLYWWSWSAQIKPVWDRLIPYGADGAPRNLSGKGAILLATAGDDDPGCFEGLRFSFARGTEYLGMMHLGEICASGVNAKGAIQGSEWLEKAEALGRSLSA
ncbi:flavodoxin family protein [Aminiphilus circumscriptus]|jgi:multimeric flavodoxin WrbA|uniref:flavodoxin family protein n=1 Tax=Aminiphilus circumscriptus TaxID=290732 RepID=UPI000492D50C|nr:flavodoxin family protein [Aminiphilus circumscriptus]